MALQPAKPPNRIPALPIGKMVNPNGDPSTEELIFRQTLMSSLISNMGSEGLVAPSQTTADIAEIVAAEQQFQGVTPEMQRTCQPGTFFYDTTTDKVMVTILVAGVPTLKEVSLI